MYVCVYICIYKYIYIYIYVANNMIPQAPSLADLSRGKEGPLGGLGDPA